MRLWFAVAGMAMFMSGAALAQSIPDQVTLKLTRQQVVTIGSALTELPYKTAAPLLQMMQSQIDAQTAKPKLAPAPILGPPPSSKALPPMSLRPDQKAAPK